MLQRIRDRLNREDKGFTLIELMVVVLIIAILIAIAIPTFLGARGRAQDRAAQSSLRNTVTAAKSIFTDDEDYADATVAALTAAEPAVSFVGAAVNSDEAPNEVSVNGGTSVSTAFVAAARSSNGGRCWYVTDRVAPNTNPGTWWAFNDDGTGRQCDTTTGVPAVFDADGSDGFTAGAWVRQPGDAVPS